MRELVPNLRDIGGLETTDGGRVRSGRVLRSAAPWAGDQVADGITWPPALVIDLRSVAELEDVHPLATAGARVVNLPLLSALTPGAPQQRLLGLYRLLLEDASLYLVELVREIGRSPGPALVHCAAGKDRTGVSIALLLRLVDVTREEIVADYLRTAEAEKEISARLRKVRGRWHRGALPPEYLTTPAEAIEGVLDLWDRHDGGVHGWFGAIGGSDDLVEQLRRTLLT